MQVRLNVTLYALVRQELRSNLSAWARAAHKGMWFSEKEFVAVLDDIRKALAINHVDPQANAELMAIACGMKADVVRRRPEGRAAPIFLLHQLFRRLEKPTGTAVAVGFFMVALNTRRWAGCRL
ncbi:hypothetical protein [Polaromonas sp.]|uniref:hypothetical protein n=1 Tax=Polaromonas sp. TaxID=1869339 RepID=UPI00181F7773|nr:hypothetical protein [Polaromonas sp.]NMM08475.1 hypothetical protein [Polaromonas sp.]